MSERPKVTKREFDEITCNNCGACCETLWLPSPLKLAQFISESEEVTNPSPEWKLENDRFIRWISHLTPTGRTIPEGMATDPGYTTQYCCSRFKRHEDGTGYCSEYEDRPSACRGFPYGRPVHAVGFEACSWNVDIIPDSPVEIGRKLFKSVFGNR